MNLEEAWLKMELSKRDIAFRNFQMKKFSVKKMVPTVTMTKYIDARNLLDIKNELNKEDSTVKVTLTHMIIKSVADTLVDFPLLFNYFYKGKIVHSSKLVINIPVEEENHVKYIVIHSPNSKSIQEIAKISNEEVKNIKDGKGTFWVKSQDMAKHPIQLLGKSFIKIAEEMYGNFAISNFGSFQIDNGNIALSSPMTAGICVGAMTSNKIPLTISFDHRVIDGAYVGHFMKSLQGRLENTM
jgi:pyruvate/2-oxoglutarate dehydrogenase complex dihydrolipoamide acyltransferase (E2) component